MAVGHIACTSGPEHASATRRLAQARRRERHLAAALAGKRRQPLAQERLSAARADVASRKAWLHWIEETSTQEPWADGEWDTTPRATRDAPAATWVMAAEPASVRELTARVVAFARARRLGEPLIADLRLATSEAVTNTVLHAFREALAPGEVTGSIKLDEPAARITLTVTDDGMGMSPRPDSPGLGHGLALIGRVAEEMTVRRGPRGLGTQIRMTFVDSAPYDGDQPRHCPSRDRGQPQPPRTVPQSRGIGMVARRAGGQDG